MKRVIIVGAGFGGINAAKILAKNKNISLLMIDKKNHHLFQPLLYQVATAGLSPANIATPIRTVLSKYGPNCQTIMTKAEHVDLKKNIVETQNGNYNFDYLILACGASHSYFGHDEFEEYAPGLKTLEEAREIRRRVFLAFEQAEREPDKSKHEALLSFVVIGGGPTGVELAGSLGEISNFTLNKEFKNIDPASTKILLIEAGPRILSSFTPKISERVKKDLKSLGVEVWNNCLVSCVDENGINIGDKRINAATVLWAAGVKPSSLGKSLNCEHDDRGRVMVEKDLSLKENPNVFIVGDMGHFKNADGKPLPQVATVAIQQGKQAALNILATIRKRPRKPFFYVDKGQMATVGRGRAVAEIWGLRSSGFFAWLIWLAVHIYYLIGFGNRILVMTQWAMAFFSFKKGARLIQNPDWKSKD